jgi:short-chain dehydrogenase/reductase SDR
MEFSGRSILVTGASSGIGRAMAKHFYACGAKVILVARREEALASLAEELGDRALVCAEDLSVLENIQKIFIFCKENGIKLDGIVHCAGVTANMPLRANDIAQMEQIMHVNVEALVQICKFASSKRYTNDGAGIIAMSSTASLRGDRGIAVYSSSKAAVNILVKSAAMELSSRKIRINAIAPAMVRTEMYYKTIREIPGIEDSIIANQNLGIIEPEYLAYLAEFLLSERSKFISGEVITVGAGRVY